MMISLSKADWLFIAMPLLRWRSNEFSCRAYYAVSSSVFALRTSRSPFLVFVGSFFGQSIIAVLLSGELESGKESRSSALRPGATENLHRPVIG